jgi:hypothetical protein
MLIFDGKLAEKIFSRSFPDADNKSTSRNAFPFLPNFLAYNLKQQNRPSPANSANYSWFGQKIAASKPS